MKIRNQQDTICDLPLFEKNDECDECCDPALPPPMDAPISFDECMSTYRPVSKVFSKLHPIANNSSDFDPMNPSGDATYYSFKVIAYRFKDASHEFTGINDCLVEVDPFSYDCFDDAYRRMASLAKKLSDEAINYELVNHSSIACGLKLRLWHPQIEYPSPCIAIAGWKNKLKPETHTIAMLQIIKT